MIIGVAAIVAPSLSGGVLFADTVPGMASIGAAGGVGWAIAEAVSEGTRRGVRESMLGALGAGIIFSSAGSVVAGIAGGVACGLGLYLGGRWATRQVADEETRKRLANPDRIEVEGDGESDTG